MQKKRTARFPGLAVVVVVLALCVGVYFLAVRIVDARLPRINMAIGVPAMANQAIKPLGDGFIYYDGSSLHAMDGRGRQVWSYPAGSLAQFNVGEGGVAVWSGTTLSLLNAQTGTPLYSSTLDTNIIGAQLGKSYAAVQIEREVEGNKTSGAAGREHNSTVLLLDPGGRRVDTIDIENQTVIDFGFFSDDQMFWTMTLDTEGTVPICTISSYKPMRFLTGFFRDTEQLLYSVMFQPNKIRVAGLTHIKDFDYHGAEITKNRILVHGWYMIDADSKQNDPLMAFAPTANADGTGNISDLRLIRDQEDRIVRLPYPAKHVSVKRDTVYAFSADRLMVCRRGAIEPEVYSLPVQIDRVIALTDSNTAIVTGGSSVFLVPLP